MRKRGRKHLRLRQRHRSQKGPDSSPSRFLLFPEKAQRHTETSEAGSETFVQTGPKTSGFEDRLSDCLYSMRSAQPPVTNVDQAVSLMKMLMAVYESRETKTEARLDGAA